MFQPWRGTTLYLGYISIFTSVILAPPHPTCFNCCYGSFYLPFYPTIFPLVSISLHIASLLHLLHTSSSGVKRCPPGIFLPPPPSSLRRSYLLPAPHACFCHHIPRLLVPPFSPSACTHVLVCPYRYTCCWSLLITCVPASTSICDTPPLVNFWCLVSYWVTILARKGKGTRCIHYLAVVCLRYLPPKLLVQIMR